MTIRPPQPDDADDILAIVRAHNVPKEWTWPEGKHGLVVATDHVLAFCILTETIYGLVISELWEEKTRAGFRALALLSYEIENIAQRLADERGGPLTCGGVIRLDRDRHIAALRKRGYGDEAVVLGKVFLPQHAEKGIEVLA
jgi:hypothetical protein